MREYGMGASQQMSLVSSSSEILSHGKLILFYKNLLDCVETILFIENKHCFFVVIGIYRTETQRAITIGNEDGVRSDTCSAIITIGECLYLRQKD